MLSNITIAVFFFCLEFLLGGAIGVSAAAVAYRPRINLVMAYRAALFGGAVFLLVAALCSLSASHQTFHNGVLLDVDEFGRSVWLQNRIARFAIALCVLSSVAAGILVGLFGRRSGGHW